MQPLLFSLVGIQVLIEPNGLRCPFLKSCRLGMHGRRQVAGSWSSQSPEHEGIWIMTSIDVRLSHINDELMYAPHSLPRGKCFFTPESESRSLESLVLQARNLQPRFRPNLGEPERWRPGSRRACANI